MKPLIEWSPGRIFARCYLPALALSLPSLMLPYHSTARLVFMLLAEIWYMGCYALYLGSITQALANKLTAKGGETALAGRLRLVIVYVILPILALFRPFRMNLLPALPIGHPLFQLVVAILCVLYPAYSTAQSLTSAEQGRPTRFSENVGTFLSLCFFPFTVFFIQPRVQTALAADRIENDLSK